MQNSNNSAQKYWMSNHLVEGSNGLLDPLSTAISRMLKTVTRYTVYTYRGEPLTTLAYNVYGNTSIWWAILYYNGYILPTDIQNGDVLKFPDRDQLSSFLGKSVSVFGTDVTL